MTDMKMGTWRQKIYGHLFDIRTRVGRKMEYFWIAMAVASVFLVFIESGDPQPLRVLVAREDLYLNLEYCLPRFSPLNISCVCLRRQKRKTMRLLFSVLLIY